MRHSTEPKQENMSKNIDFCHLQKIYSTNTGKN